MGVNSLQSTTPRALAEVDGQGERLDQKWAPPGGEGSTTLARVGGVVAARGGGG